MKLLDKENSLKIQYVDNHLLIVVKDANLLTQPNGIDPTDLQTKAKNWIKQKYDKRGEVFLHPIHRLDKEVEGLVIFARTSKALSRLNLQMREKKIKRKYLAQIEGKVSKKSDHLKDYIKHSSHRAIIVNKDQTGAKLAHLSYKVIEETKNTSRVEIELLTGRYHQIRAQMANMSHPIIGDKKYGSKKESKKIHLKCFYVEFLHPIKKDKMNFKIKNTF